jgi:hypothetical protein
MSFCGVLAHEDCGAVSSLMSPELHAVHVPGPEVQVTVVGSTLNRYDVPEGDELPAVSVRKLDHTIRPLVYVGGWNEALADPTGATATPTAMRAVPAAMVSRSSVKARRSRRPQRLVGDIVRS